jgi:bifunctional enzyme CysN/CysC
VTAAVRTQTSGLSEQSLLRFCVCGSVDNGKSTLIGRLLYEGQNLPDDQLAAMQRDSARAGATNTLDFSLAVDGLAAEREQGITIDVAYRYFRSEKRRFIIIDTPGHEQYTRNMATGASHADLAVILTDISHGTGLTMQTRRHTYVCWLLGIRHFVLAVNKMDVVAYSETDFNKAADEFYAFTRELGVKNALCIPVAATQGDNIMRRSENTPWYRGPALFEHLEIVEPATSNAADAFRMPLQLVQRIGNSRALAGTIVAGEVKIGDPILVQPGGTEASVAKLSVAGEERGSAVATQSIVIELDRHVDAGRGDVLAAAQSPLSTTDHLSAHVVWLAAEPMLQSRRYIFRHAVSEQQATVTSIKYAISMDSLEHTAAKTMQLNDIAVCNLQLDGNIAFEPYEMNRELGSFILIDRLTNETTAMGMIAHSLWRSENVRWQDYSVDRALRAGQKNQKPAVVWFTGLSGAGKSTIANALERKLVALGKHTYVLDGDNVRHGLNRDLGFTDADRVENLRRLAETARLMADAGLIVLVCAISPFARERLAARETMKDVDFFEVFVDAPLEVCERRDPKGLYRKARLGALKNFTGIDSPYEAPVQTDVRIDTSTLSVEEAVSQLLPVIERKNKQG